MQGGVQRMRILEHQRHRRHPERRPHEPRENETTHHPENAGDDGDRARGVVTHRPYREQDRGRDEA